MVQILIADLTTSLDNVLAVAGAARTHPGSADRGPHPLDYSHGFCRELDRQAAKSASVAPMSGSPSFSMAFHMIWEGGLEVTRVLGWTSPTV
jgi:hypothetical protein